MAGKENVDIKRSDQFQEVDEELSRAMAELDCSIERVSAIFDGTVDEDSAVEAVPLAADTVSTEEDAPSVPEAKEEGGPKVDTKSPDSQDDTPEANAE